MKPSILAIVGVGEADLAPKTTAAGMMAQASARAIADAGLRREQIDGLASASAYYFMPTMTLGEYLGIRPRYADGTNLGGSSFVAQPRHAQAALAHGLCSYVLIAYGSTQRSDSGRLVTAAEELACEVPYGAIYPASAYALVAQRHMREFGTAREQLAAVAVESRKWGALNPLALRRDPTTVADIVASPIVSSPLHKLDCCLVTDGGAALVVTTAERAADLRKKPVYLLGAGEAHTHRYISGMPDLMTTAAVTSGREAFRAAGLTPVDVDVAQVYDAFTINLIVAFEDLGFCRKGEGGDFVSSGALGPGGALPTNTTGGGLAYRHPGMLGAFLLVEAARQLQGECGDRQVPGAEVGLVHGIGGLMASTATVLLGASSPG